MNIRKFATGGIRDTANGKLDYYGTRHPLLEQSFARFMQGHSKMPDGSFRPTTNWWKGWDKEISLQSLIRHLEDLQAINAGYCVIETRKADGSVEKTYVNEETPVSGDIKTMHVIDAEDACNAIRFNAMAYLLQIIDKSK